MILLSAISAAVKSLLIYLHSRIDSREIANGRAINHPLETSILVVIVAATSMLIFGLTKLAIADFFLFWPFEWIAFDLTLNIMRGLPYNYLGTSSKPSVLDVFLEKTGISQYVVKGAFLAISIVAVTLFLKY